MTDLDLNFYIEKIEAKIKTRSEIKAEPEIKIEPIDSDNKQEFALHCHQTLGVMLFVNRIHSLSIRDNARQGLNSRFKTKIATEIKSACSGFPDMNLYQDDDWRYVLWRLMEGITTFAEMKDTASLRLVETLTFVVQQVVDVVACHDQDALIEICFEGAFAKDKNNFESRLWWALGMRAFFKPIEEKSRQNLIDNCYEWVERL